MSVWSALRFSSTTVVVSSQNINTEFDSIPIRDDILQLTTPRTFISTLTIASSSQERRRRRRKTKFKKNNYYFNYYKRNQQFIETIIVQPPLLHAAASCSSNNIYNNNKTHHHEATVWAMTLAIYRTASVFRRQLPAHWNKPTLPNIVMSAFSRALAKSKRHRGEQQSSSIDPSSVSEAEVIRLTDILRENLAAKTKRGSTQRRTIEIAFRNIDRDRSDTINSDEFATAVYPFLQGIKKHFVQAIRAL